MTTYALANDTLNFGQITTKQDSHLTPNQWLEVNRLTHLTVIAAHLPANKPVSQDTLYISRQKWDQNHAGTIVFIALPKGGGGGDSNPLAIIASLAVVAFAPWAAGAILGTTTGLAFTALSAGIGIVGNMLVSKAFAPQSKPRNQALPAASPTYSNNISGNSAQLGNTIPIQYGELTFPPDFIQQPYVVYTNDEEYFCGLYCLGVGAFHVENIGFGMGLDIELKSISSAHAELIYARDSSASVASSLGARVHSWASNTSLKITTATPANPSIIPTVTYKAADLSNLELENDGWTKWVHPIPRHASANKIVFSLGFQGLGYVNDNNGFDSRTVEFELQAQRIDNAGNAVGSVFMLTGGSTSISGATADTLRRGLNFSVGLGRYRVRMRRTNNPSTNTRVRDKAVWVSCLAHNTDADLPVGNTYLALVIKATGQMSGNQHNQLYVQAKRKLDPVHSSLLRSAPSSSPYIALVDMLRAEYGLNASNHWDYLPDAIDLNSWENERGTGIYQQDVNFRIDTESSMIETAALLLRGVVATPYIIGGSIYVAHNNNEQPISLELSEDVIEFTESIDLPPSLRPDALIVEYWDTRYNRQHSVVCKVSSATPQRTETIQLYGITDINDAYRHGMMQLSAALLQTYEISVKTNQKGRIPSPQDRVLLNFADTQGEARTGYICSAQRDGSFIKLSLSDDPLIDYSQSPAALVSIHFGGRSIRDLRIDRADQPNNFDELWIRLSSNPSASSLVQLQNYLIDSDNPATYSVVDVSDDDSLQGADSKTGIVARVLSSKMSEEHVVLDCLKDEPLVYQSWGHASESNANINEPFNQMSSSDLGVSLSLMPEPYPTRSHAAVRISWKHQAGALGYKISVGGVLLTTISSNEFFYVCRSNDVDFSALTVVITPWAWGRDYFNRPTKLNGASRSRTFNLYQIDNSLAPLPPAWIPNFNHTLSNGRLTISWSALSGASQWQYSITGYDENWNSESLASGSVSTNSKAITLTKDYRQVFMQIHTSSSAWAEDVSSGYSIDDVRVTNASTSQRISWGFINGLPFRFGTDRIEWAAATNATDYVVTLRADIRRYDAQLGTLNQTDYNVTLISSVSQTKTYILQSAIDAMNDPSDLVMEVYLSVTARNSVDSITRTN